MTRQTIPISRLTAAGIEVLRRGAGSRITLPQHTVIEAPTSLKWTQYEHSIELGAFSYQVSGHCFGARIGRYCSFGEEVQIGRQNHPMNWISTSPAFYLGDRLFDLGDGFAGAKDYHGYRIESSEPATRVKITTIGNDVWVGHGAYIAAGVTVGDGAVIAAHAVIAKDVPPYAVVAGNPGVIKKWRFDPSMIGPVLRSRWWRYAPWQLQHLDPARPGAFAKGVFEMQGEPEFAPDILDLRQNTP